MAPYIPTVPDIFAVRDVLAAKLLPLELVLDILDLARYWLEKHTSVDHYEALVDDDFSLEYSEARLYCYVDPFNIDMPWPHKVGIREIEFTIVSHDQGWTTEGTKGTYMTSSWFEVSIIRGHPCDDFFPDGYVGTDPYSAMAKRHRGPSTRNLVARPSSEMEAQRLHCEEMKKIALPPKDETGQPLQSGETKTVDEGKYAWYLQGNEVAREKSLFEGEVIRRYHVTWGCRVNPVWKGNEGAGKGEDFVDSLRYSDMICVWARAKRRGWENHVHGIKVTVRSHLK